MSPKCWLRLIALLVLLVLPLIPSTTLAQEELAQVYISSTGVFTFNYPAGWALREDVDVGAFLVMLADSQATLDMMQLFEDTNPQPGQVGIFVVGTIANAPDLPAEVTPTTPVLDLMNIVSENLFEGQEGLLWTNPLASQFEIGRRYAHMRITNPAEQAEVLMLTVETASNDRGLLIAFSHINEMDAYEPTILAIAESLHATGALVVPTPVPETGSGVIAYGASMEGNLVSPAGDQWTFTGAAGDVVTIGMTATFDTYLELRDPLGSLIISDDDSGGDFQALINQFALPQTGIYTITARSYGSETGAYTLSLEQTIVRRAGPISYGEEVNATLAKAAGERWSFSGSAGDIVSVRMTSDFDNVLELYAPDGTLLASDDDSGGNYNAFIRGVSLPETGTYVIIARSYGDSTGSYTLELTQLALSAPVHLQYGDTVAGTTFISEGNRYTFTGAAGEQVAIIMVGNFDTVLELYDAQDRLLASNDTMTYGSGSMIEDFSLPSAGEYTIVARGYGAAAGDYTLMLGRALETPEG